MSPPAKLLVVANRTADSDELRAALLERSERGVIEVTLLAPAAWEVADPHGGAELGGSRDRQRSRSARQPSGRTGVAPDGAAVLVEQGHAMGRPSPIRVQVSGERVRIGGAGVGVADGTLTV